MTSLVTKSNKFWVQLNCYLKAILEIQFNSCFGFRVIDFLSNLNKIKSLFGRNEKILSFYVNSTYDYRKTYFGF